MFNKANGVTTINVFLTIPKELAAEVFICSAIEKKKMFKV